MTSTSTISSRETSLMNLNQLVDKLEFAIARNSTPAILALTKQIHSDGTAFYTIYNDYIGLTKAPEDFQAMFRRFKAAEAAGAAAIASKETKQVTAGVDEANQSTAGVADVRASEPGSSFTPPTTPRVVSSPSSPKCSASNGTPSPFSSRTRHPSSRTKFCGACRYAPHSHRVVYFSQCY